MILFGRSGLFGVIIYISYIIYPSENEVLDYLSDLAEKGRSYSVINSHKSAIGQTLASYGNNLFLSNTIFSRFMKGVFVIEPPRPKYTCTLLVLF